MKSFLEYISEAATPGKNTHLVHVEDSVLYGGVDGARAAINALRSIRDTLSGSSKSSHNITLKLDGAPAVFAGIDPTDGKFFVAKKGIFNKNPKVYKSIADIKADTSGDLAEKLIESLKYFSKLNIRGVLQGDLMFTKKDLKIQTIDGQKFITFQPNTIVYAIPESSELGKQIKRAKIGVVWHTKYDGKTFEDMRASFGVDASSLTNVPEVWSQDATIKDLSGNILFTKSDTDEITKILSEAGKIFNKLSSSTLKQISANPQIAQTIETYSNSFIRKGQSQPSPKQKVIGLMKFVNVRFDKEKDQRKSISGKDAIEQKRQEFNTFFSDENIRNLISLFELQNKIVEAKSMIIDKLESISSLNTFVRTKDGFKVTKQEGYVVVDTLSNGALKLVDRLEFSLNNFSSEILKGWN